MDEARRPQKNSFELIVKLRKLNSYLMYAIFVISICSFYVAVDYKIWGIPFKMVLDSLNVLLMISFSGLTFTIDYSLFPNAEKIRRIDFINNSFGSRFNLVQSENYFSNEEVGQGIYKAAVNLFENCLFTFKISKKMRPDKIAKSLIFCVWVICLAVQGFKNSQVSVPLLQLFLSANILGELVKLLIFVDRNGSYFNDLVNLFSNKDFKSDVLKYLPQFLKIYSDYETNLAWGRIQLDSKIYNELNPILSEKWQKIKNELEI